MTVQPEVLGASDWLTIDQTMIDQFGAVTRDPDPMHVDPEWCALHSPYGQPIAFGFLTLSLLTAFSHQIRPWPEGVFGLNYGFDRVRFLAPVAVGSRIRAHAELLSTEPRAAGGVLARTRYTIEIERDPKPALVADWLGLILPLPEAG